MYKFIEVYEKYSNKKPVIDIGCGFNKLPITDYVAFDKATIVGGYIGVVNHFGDFHDMSDFADNTFEFINATHVLEHTHYPEKALKEWVRILKIGGIMFLHWPNLPRHSREEIQRFYQWEKMIVDDNMSAYEQSGGKMSWVSYDKNNKPFLDVHFNNMSMNEVKNLLPKSIKILEENNGFQLILRKTG